MEITDKQNKSQELLAKALKESWKNEAFKKELIANPIDAIENLTGEKLNLKAGSKMVVTDQSKKDTFYFNIPKSTSLEDVELTEEQLEAVAGGDLGIIGAIIRVVSPSLADFFQI
jgi:hypothetical protein